MEDHCPHRLRGCYDFACCLAFDLAYSSLTLTASIIANFWHFFFWGGHYPIGPSNVWYERAVWGNVVATLPLGIIAALGFWWHHSGVHKKLDHQARQLELHGRHLKALIEALDPASEGGLADVLDRLDPKTPSGIGAILERLDKLEKR